jgi:hypothetical protein
LKLQGFKPREKKIIFGRKILKQAETIAGRSRLSFKGSLKDV